MGLFRETVESCIWLNCVDQLEGLQNWLVQLHANFLRSSKVMSTYLKRLLMVLALIMLAGTSRLFGQAVPSVTKPSAAAFAEVSGGETGQQGDKAIGGIIGGYFQTNGLLGVEARAGGLRVKSAFPFYFFTIGPRLSMSFPLFTAYAYGGAGIARYSIPPSYPTPPYTKEDVVLQAAVGIDHSFGRIAWRVADFTVSRAKGDGGYPWMLSTGLRVKF